MIATILAPRGHRVVPAADGLEALQRLRDAVEPFVVLLDLVMPRMDGISVCAEVERDAQLRAAGHRIILMSSSARLLALELPHTIGQLPKPFSRQQLVEAVQAAR
jgi:two-component system phosphate regulon response regulator PhoB